MLETYFNVESCWVSNLLSEMIPEKFANYSRNHIDCSWNKKFEKFAIYNFDPNFRAFPRNDNLDA